MNDYFCAAQDEGDKLASKLVDSVGDLAESELRDILDDWHGRYPRHQFRGFQGHGMLVLSIKPPIGRAHHVYEKDGWGNLNYIPHDMKRGAIATLDAEVQRVHDCWAKLEWRTGTRETDFIIAPEPDQGGANTEAGR